MREVVFDLETTGLSYKTGDRIIEIGCVEIVNREITGRVFNLYVNPEYQVSDAAFKVHGISNQFLSNHPKFCNVADSFIEFVQKDTLVVHNAKFDVPFMNFELENSKRSVLKNTVIDTLSIARKKFPGEKASLDALCKKFKIDLSFRKLHGALKDALLLAKVYLHLTRSARQSVISFTKTPSLLHTKRVPKNAQNHTIIKPSLEELSQYKEFISSFKSTLCR